MADPDVRPPEGERAALRQRIRGVLRTDSEFQAFCIDWFPGVQARFGDNMDRLAKENLLLTIADVDAIGRVLDRHVVRRRRRRSAALASVVVAVVAGVCAVAAFLKVDLSIPPIEPFPPEAPGVVIGGPRVKAGKAEVLEGALKARDPQYHAVRSVPYAQGASRDDFLKAAGAANAAVAVVVGSDGMAEVYPQKHLANDPLYRGPLSIRAANPPDQENAAVFLNALVSVVRQGFVHSPGDSTCPIAGAGSLKRESLLTLLLVPACWAVRVDPTRFAGICSTPPSYQNETCALALYLDPSSSRETLEKLSTVGHERFRTAARLRLAEADCKAGDLGKATKAVLALDLSNELDLCRKMQLPSIASCIVTKSAPSFENLEPTIKEIEGRHLEKKILQQSGCFEPDRARAIARLAFWQGQRGEWALPWREYDDAYNSTKEPAYALGKAEALLQLGAALEAKRALDLIAESSGRELQVKAALLLWVAGRQAKNEGWSRAAEGKLLELTKEHEGKVALLGREVDESLRALVCRTAQGSAPRRPAGGAGSPCLYDLLLRPSSSDELRASFGAP